MVTARAHKAREYIKSVGSAVKQFTLDKVDKKQIHLERERLKSLISERNSLSSLIKSCRDSKAQNLIAQKVLTINKKMRAITNNNKSPKPASKSTFVSSQPARLSNVPVARRISVMDTTKKVGSKLRKSTKKVKEMNDLHRKIKEIEQIDQINKEFDMISQLQKVKKIDSNEEKYTSLFFRKPKSTLFKRAVKKRTLLDKTFHPTGFKEQKIEVLPVEHLVQSTEVSSIGEHSPLKEPASKRNLSKLYCEILEQERNITAGIGKIKSNREDSKTKKYKETVDTIRNQNLKELYDKIYKSGSKSDLEDVLKSEEDREFWLKIATDW